MTQIVDYKRGFESLQIEFVRLSEVDSVLVTEFSYFTDCVGETLEENASWPVDLREFPQSWEVVERDKKNTFMIMGTVSGFTTTFPDKCEWSSYVEVVAYVYTRQGTNRITLRSHTEDIKTKIIQ